ncbi:MAG TPA: glutamate racemase [Verrucomicrobiales bacterium]|nr:glutamate racemase [Verrucomicrobiales bacterium]
MPRKTKHDWCEAPIGIFDSGLGGLTVAREVHRLMPHEDLIYLGDTARVPYGTKTAATVTRFACEDTQFLMGKKVKAVVVACNSACAWGLSTLERHFDVPVFGVILPGAKAALEATRSNRIGIIGTSATIRSQAYHVNILARNDDARLFAKPCPLLVPLVEEGWTNHPVTIKVLREYLRPLLKRKIDTLVLGCTHYPLLKTALRKVVGEKIKLVDSAESCAEFVRERLHFLKLLATGRRRQGVIWPFVTDEPERFGDFAERFLGCETEPPRKVELPPCRIMV